MSDHDESDYGQEYGDEDEQIMEQPGEQETPKEQENWLDHPFVKQVGSLDNSTNDSSNQEEEKKQENWIDKAFGKLVIHEEENKKEANAPSNNPKSKEQEEEKMEYRGVVYNKAFGKLVRD